MELRRLGGLRQCHGVAARIHHGADKIETAGADFVLVPDRDVALGLGGEPLFLQNEKTVNTDHVAGITVRNPEIVEVARHYGTTIRTCLPADPETKNGSEATVRAAKADLGPRDVNLREHYKTFGELEAACHAFCDKVNSPAPTGRLGASRSSSSPRNSSGRTHCRGDRSPPRSAPPGG